MKAERLKRILRKALSKVEELNDEDEVRVTSNTYFLGNCSTFLGISSEGYVNLDCLDVERAELVKLTDIDLCIALEGEENPEGLMTFDELHRLCVENSVVVKLESEKGPSLWPTFSFDGLTSNVATVLERLGFDEETVDDMIEEALE